MRFEHGAAVGLVLEHGVQEHARLAGALVVFERLSLLFRQLTSLKQTVSPTRCERWERGQGTMRGQRLTLGPIKSKSGESRQRSVREKKR